MSTTVNPAAAEEAAADIVQSKPVSRGALVRRRFMRNRWALGGIVVVGILFLPFVLLGPFRMFSFAWTIRDNSLAMSSGKAAWSAGRGLCRSNLFMREARAAGSVQPWGGMPPRRIADMGPA